MATVPFFLVWPQRPSHLLLDGTTRLEFPRTYLLPGRLISVRRVVKYYNLARFNEINDQLTVDGPEI